MLQLHGGAEARDFCNPSHPRQNLMSKIDILNATRSSTFVLRSSPHRYHGRDTDDPGFLSVVHVSHLFVCICLTFCADSR